MSSVIISVIIPSYNSASTIEYTIKGLLEQNKYHKNIKEIIIVDSSDDNCTRKTIEFYKDNVITIYLQKKTIPANSRNIGAAKATGNLLAFIDSDAYPEHDWAENIIKAYNNGFLIGGGSYKIPPFQKMSSISLSQYYLQFNEFMPYGNARIKTFTPSCNMFCQKKLFEELGGFPQIRASEDTLFGIKASKNNDLYFVPSAKVYHIFRTTFSSFINNQKLLGKYVYIYRKRKYNPLWSKHLLPFFFFIPIVFIKILKIKMRVVTSSFKEILKFHYALPYFIIGIFFWTIGFLSGAISKDT